MISPAGIRDLEEAADRAWPARRTAAGRDWVARFADGMHRRLNSASVWSADDLDAARDAIESWYAGWGRRAVFKLTAASAPGLDDHLTADGYSSDAAVVVMTHDLAEVPGEAVRIDPEASEEWTDAFATISGYGPDRRRLFLEILDRIDLPTGFAGIRIDGSLVAVGMSVADDAWAGLFEMATHPAHRSRGLAKRIVAALLGWSREAGARTAYLQVFEGNRPARSVYRRAGFVPAYRYWYRVPPSGLPPVPR